MNYAKPEIVALDNATEAIERITKDGLVWADNPIRMSINAYEADD